MKHNARLEIELPTTKIAADASLFGTCGIGPSVLIDCGRSFLSLFVKAFSGSVSKSLHPALRMICYAISLYCIVIFPPCFAT